MLRSSKLDLRSHLTLCHFARMIDVAVYPLRSQSASAQIRVSIFELVWPVLMPTELAICEAHLDLYSIGDIRDARSIKVWGLTM